MEDKIVYRCRTKQDWLDAIERYKFIRLTGESMKTRENIWDSEDDRFCFRIVQLKDFANSFEWCDCNWYIREGYKVVDYHPTSKLYVELI